MPGLCFAGADPGAIVICRFTIAWQRYPGPWVLESGTVANWHYCQVNGTKGRVNLNLITIEMIFLASFGQIKTLE